MNTATPLASPRIAVLIPCLNEGTTIAKVIGDFRAALPTATIYVFDNNSTDNTAQVATQSGAILMREKRQGKGFVIATMLATVDADYYVMVDGDDTYPAERAPRLLAPLQAGDADMVVGQRLSEWTADAFRPFHIFGNKLVRKAINMVFRSNLIDVMSGYRTFTREVANHLPIVASGFDIETEMTLQLLCRGFVIRELPVPYRKRPEGSASKLRTFHDGMLVLLKILGILKAYKPLTFFGGLALLFLLAAAFPAFASLSRYLRDGQIGGVFGVVLAMGLTLASFVLLTAGVILHTINFRIFEMTNVLSKQIQRVTRLRAEEEV